MVTAGFPCQPWSAAGQGRGFDDDRWIWPDIARIVRDVGPQFVFLENVPGLLVRGGLGAVLGDLAEMGFDAEWGVLSAADAGASQLRERVYVLAFAHGSQRRQDDERGGRAGEGSDGQRQAAGRLGVGGPPLANAGSAGHGEEPGGVQGDALRRPRTLNGHQPDGGGEALADSDDSRQPRPPVLDGQPRRSDGSHIGRNGSGVLVDANGARREGERSEPASATVADAGRAGRHLGIFPPGPDDLGSWAEVLAVDPSLEPSLRRVADGPAGGVDGYDDPTRTDQLRALGNGVVPLAGALALCLLAARAGVTL